MYDKSEILKHSGWNTYQSDGLIIFDDKIFKNDTKEANIIWTEILDNIITHIDRIIEDPIEWTVQNRFWLNSRYVCVLLGINIFKDRNSTAKTTARTLLSNCQITESETGLEDSKKRQEFEDKTKKEKNIIFGNLPKAWETRQGYDDATTAVLDALTDIIYTTTDEVQPFVDAAVTIYGKNVTHNEQNSEFIMDNKSLNPKEIKSILHELRDTKIKSQVNSLRNTSLTNKEWKSFIDLAASGDTIDTKNILVAWNAVKTQIGEKMGLDSKNPHGSHETCNFSEYFHGRKRVCSNYINPEDELCSVHRALKMSAKTNKSTNSLFPVFFGKFVFYVEFKYEYQIIGKTPRTFEISRKLMTTEFEVAKGKQ